MAAPSLQTTMKVAGMGYMLWLAWKIGRSGPHNLQLNVARPVGFLGGAGLLWMNPKGRAMSTGAAASFSALAAHPFQLAGLLGPAFGAASVLSLSIRCVAGLLLAKYRRTTRQWYSVNGTLGALLAASVVPMGLKCIPHAPTIATLDVNFHY